MNQGGTTDKVFYSSLTEGIFCQGRFFYSFVREAKGLLGGKNMKISTTLNDVEKIVEIFMFIRRKKHEDFNYFE